MVAILELPSVRRMVSLVSVEQYHRTAEYNAAGRRTELVRGIVIEKMSKSPLHTTLLRRLFRLVQTAAGPTMLVYKEDPLTFLDSEPEPDISVIEGREEDYQTAHPTTARLVIEVAITTLELDRAKATIYAEANIPEYWLVNAREQIVEVYAEPVKGSYAQHRLYTRSETLTSTVLPALRVELAALFVG